MRFHRNCGGFVFEAAEESVFLYFITNRTFDNFKPNNSKTFINHTKARFTYHDTVVFGWIVEANTSLCMNDPK